MNEKIGSALQQIDKRIGNYTLPLYTKLIDSSNLDPIVRERGFRTIRIALRLGRFYDLFSETEDIDFFEVALSTKNELYQMVSPSTSNDLEKIGQKIIGFFDLEKTIWRRVKSGEKISDEDIEKYSSGKASDTFFYGRIIREFVSQDVTPIIYADMRLMDLLYEIKEFSEDVKRNEPNQFYMMLSQHLTLDEIPLEQSEAIQLAKRLGIHEKIIQRARSIINSVKDFDYTKIEFLKELLSMRLIDIERELQTSGV